MSDNPFTFIGYYFSNCAAKHGFKWLWFLAMLAIMTGVHLPIIFFQKRSMLATDEKVKDGLLKKLMLAGCFYILGWSLFCGLALPLQSYTNAGGCILCVASEARQRKGRAKRGASESSAKKGASGDSAKNGLFLGERSERKERLVPGRAKRAQWLVPGRAKRAQRTACSWASEASAKNGLFKGLFLGSLAQRTAGSWARSRKEGLVQGLVPGLARAKNSLFLG